ncbi:MAG: amino acid adenylation domain-containing protein [Magnetococcales bacterium]|nr:amino acid adenylation domain-containing protein [Magnetococcales bacterium]
MMPFSENRTIHQLFEEQVERTPEAIALVCGDASVSYAELNRRANRLAHQLNGLEIDHELPIGICLDGSLDLAIGVLGILKSGHGYMPLDATCPLERLAYMLRDSCCSMLLTQQKHLDTLPTQDLSIHCLDADQVPPHHGREENPLLEVTSDSLAYILYTSGSTGQPKGIVMPHRALVNLILWQNGKRGHAATTRTLQFAPISFDVSFQEIFSTWCAGGTLVMMPAILRRNAMGLLQFLMDQHIVRLFLPPVALHQLAMAAIDAEIVPVSLQEVITAGDQLQITPAIAELFNTLPHCTLHNQYGPSETHVVTEHTLRGVPATWPKRPPIGLPVANCQIHLLNERLQPVPQGQSGEIHIGGAALSDGYWQRPDLNKSRFIPNPHGPGRLYKTGDLARQLPDGACEFLGRLDHQVKIRGFRIELGEIEALLVHHPMVNEAVVLSYEDAAQDKRLVAYVVPRSAGGSKVSGDTHEEHVHLWRRIWDEAYRTSAQQWEDNFHLGGWNDSYTGAALPETQVREWVTLTVERIMALSPRRVLEIGCGSGLLLFRIAPKCDHYCGTDLSAAGIQHIQQHIHATPLEQSVTLLHTAADAIPALSPVDTVILNGVIQFFPGAEYFFDVLEQILKRVAPGGQIFIGDIQSHALLELFHTSVQLYQAPDDLPVWALRQRIQERMTEEKKLLFSPAFFAELPRRFPRISHVEMQLKPGRSVNELTRFRFDVIVHVEKSVTLPTNPPVWTSWQEERFSWEGMRQHLTACAPEFHAIARVPNGRLWRDVQAMTRMAACDAAMTIGALKGQLRPGGIDPAAWWECVVDLPYRAYVCWSNEADPGCYDVLLQRRDSATTVTSALFPGLRGTPSMTQPWSAFTNDPLQSKEALLPKLRHYLKQKLPDHMIPAAFVFMEQFPLTLSGKLDRRRLPLPKPERPALEQPFVPPGSAIEKKLAEIWTEILNVHPIGRDDGFFDLGGHSLLIMQLLSQVREAFHVDLPLTVLFENPTVAGMGQAIHRLPQGGETCTPLAAITVDELQSLVHLHDEIGPSGRTTAPSIDGAPRKIFLTGVTGFLGAFLLDELLRQTHAEIHCLVRGCETRSKAGQRIQRNLRHYGLTNWVDDAMLNPRIIPVPGDLSRPRLGLSKSEFETLAQEMESIYHIGAEVNLLYPYSAIQAANVLGTHEILRLATHRRIKPVHYTSTLGLFESSSYVQYPGILEGTRLAPQDFIHGGYAQSKWIAEQLLNLARSRGVPISIYRPGGVIGHSQTGMADTDSIVIVLLRYFLQQRSIPNLDMLMDMVPVDYVCQALVHLSKQTTSSERVFHLVHPQPVSLTHLAELLNALGHTIELTDYATWLSRLKAMSIHSSENPFGPILPIFTGNMPGSHLTYLEMSSIGMRFDCSNAVQGLSDSGIACPTLDQRLLALYLHHMRVRHPNDTHASMDGPMKSRCDAS